LDKHLQPRGIAPQDKIDDLLKLAEFHWQSFDGRRNAQWKVNLALWASLAALAGLLAKGEVTLSQQQGAAFTVIVGLLFLIYWLFWSTGMWLRNGEDMSRAYAMVNIARGVLGLDSLQHNESNLTTVDRIGRGRRWIQSRIAIWSDWSRGSELSITLLFCSAVVLAIWLRKAVACLPD
jgi:hypothetical protein